jgi:chemotaxis protein MotB
MKPGKGERKSKGKRSKAIAALNNVISDNKLIGIVRVSETNNGIHITIGDPALFDTGKDEIKTIILPVLEQIVEVINTGNENVRVEGHTDNVPIHNDRFKDNWELSIARAMSVIRYIRDQQVIDPRRLRPVGCGEFHPVASNDTQDGRALNRRVEIFIEMGD